jgi:hypothetical protein
MKIHALAVLALGAIAGAALTVASRFECAPRITSSTESVESHALTERELEAPP